MSNLAKRVIAGFIGIPLILGAAYFGGIYFLIFSIIVSSLALWEFCSMFEKKDLSPLKYSGVIFSAGMLVLMYSNWDNFLVLFFVTIFIITSVEIFREKKNPLNPMILVFGLLYITMPFGIMNELFRIRDFNVIIYIFILIWSCDTAAYFGGRAFGKNQLSPVSPKKTWEGSVAGFIFTLIISLLIYFIFPDKLNFMDAIVVGSIVGIFAQVGDLFESLLKRYCDVKDSSDIIPGHGGILDRFDSLIFVTPVIAIYFIATRGL